MDAVERIESQLLKQYVWALGVTCMKDLRPPDRATYTYGRTLGVVLDRRGQCQLELFIVPPGIDLIEFHTHPNVDSFEVPLAGSFDFISNGVSNLYDSTGGVLGARESVRVRETDVHGALWTPEGGAFLSFQYWLNGVPPTSVTVDFALDAGNVHHRRGLRGKQD